MAQIGDIIWCYPDNYSLTAPIVGVVLGVTAGPPETAVVRTLRYVPETDFSYGDNTEDNPFNYGLDEFEISDTPGIGKAVVALAQNMAGSAFGYVLRETTTAASLTANVWSTLTGGALSADAQGLTYDDTTGILTVETAGAYDLSLTASQSIGILSTTNMEIAIALNGTPTDCMINQTLTSQNALRNAASKIPRHLAAGDEITLVTRSSITISVLTARYLLSVSRIA